MAFVSFTELAYRGRTSTHALRGPFVDALSFLSRSARLGPFRDSAPAAWSHRAIDQSLKCSVCSSLRIGGSEKTVCCVVTQIDATKLPDDLFDIEIVTQMT